jgi:hypothetical protein
VILGNSGVVFLSGIAYGMFLEPGIRPAFNPDQNPRPTDVDENPEYMRGNSRCLVFCSLNMALKVFLCPSSLVCIPNGIEIPLGRSRISYL